MTGWRQGQPSARSQPVSCNLCNRRRKGGTIRTSQGCLRWPLNGSCRPSECIAIYSAGQTEIAVKVKLSGIVRKLHYWVSLGIALPTLIIITSGLLLQTKKHWSWVQPVEQQGSSTVPKITWEALMGSLVSTPSLGVRGWEDLSRIDVRPSRGLAKVWLKSGVEVQVDIGTGAILQHAYRRSDPIESIHDGSWFGGEWTKLGLFLPTGVLLLFLWGSGLWLVLMPMLAKRRKKQPD